MDKATLASSSILGILWVLRSRGDTPLNLCPGKLLILTRTSMCSSFLRSPLANRIGWQIQLVVSCLWSFPSVSYSNGQVRNNLLYRISRLRVPPELGAAEVSCRKMDEVSCTRFAKSSMFWSNISLVWTYLSGVLVYIAMQLARASPVCLSFVSSLECVKVP